LGPALSVGSNDDGTAEAPVPASWDYGSGPGKNSNRWVGERNLPIRYQPENCAARFRLKNVRHEYVLVDRDTRKKSQPAFIVATLEKIVSGEVVYVEPPMAPPEEGEALICCCYPRVDDTVEDDASVVLDL